MANIILPLITYFLYSYGRVENIKSYGEHHSGDGIFENAEVVERTLNELNSTYYVLPDKNVPLSVVGVPADIALSMKEFRFRKRSSFSRPPPDLVDLEYPESANVMFVTEYKTVERSVKEDQTPIPDWQRRIDRDLFNPRNPTHYVEKMGFGGRCYSFLTVQSNVSGDIPVITGIIRDVMGASGKVEDDIVDLWNKAVKAINESKDVRGTAEYYNFVRIREASKPSLPIHENAENLLNYLKEFPKHVESKPKDVSYPLYLSLRPLRDLDASYPLMLKNVETESYLNKLRAMFEDVDYVKHHLNLMWYFFDHEDDETVFGLVKSDEFEWNVRNVHSALDDLVRRHSSMYDSVNVADFENTFAFYRQGLVNSTENYLMQLKRLSEEIFSRCENRFLTPTRGLLHVEVNEVSAQGVMDSAEECQHRCLQDERCRSVGYDDSDKQCLIYFRSTYSARIVNPEGGNKIYDRVCKFEHRYIRN